ncbi:MAG: tetratricopeptide repeat protein [Deltaproteobacteria bacterium]|nr:tetratricopeptide repeat protein [Deltaproteobacteria bacterium]
MSEPPQQQDLSQLEMAFAADPKAFVPLTNAYLQLGRFMEAMVVCKKGIKAQPESIDGKLLLARVYAEQGKVPKAVEELRGLLAVAPNAAPAHFLLGQMHERSGRFDEAIESFKETLRNDRKHNDAKAALKAKGIDFDPGPSPEEVAEKLAAEQAAYAKVAAEEAARKAVEEAEAQAAADAAAARAREAKARAIGQANRGTIPTGPVGADHGATQPANPNAGPVDPAFAAAYAQNLYGYPGPNQQQPGKKSLGLGFTFGLGALLLLVVVAIVGGLVVHKGRQAAIKELLLDQQQLVKRDTTLGHKKALEKLEAALKIDDSQELAVSQYAYSLNVLSERGLKEIDAKVGPATLRAEKVAEDHPLSIAARMINLRMAGKPADAAALATKLGDPKSLSIPVRVELGRAYAALGRIPDMSALAETLKDAPDPNALAFAGDAFRRTGDQFRARRALDSAIKTELDHDPARALRALLILEQDDVVNLPIALDDVSTVLEAGKDALGARQRGYATLGKALITKRARANDRESQRDIEAARLLLRNDPEMPLFDAKQAKEDKDYVKAAEFLKQAIKLDAYRLAPYLVQIEVGARSKKFADADAAYAAALGIFGDNLELGLAKGGRLLAEGKADEALTHLQTMLKTQDIAEVHRDIGKVYMLKKDYVAATTSLKKAAEKSSARGPGIQANVYTWLGRAYAAADDHKTAAATYSEALAITNEFPSTYFFLGRSMAELGEGAAAKEAFQKYVNIEPTGAYADEAKTKIAEL